MKRFISLFVLLLILGSSLIALPDIEVAKAEDTIYIRADGSVEGTDKILREEDVYTLTGNISGEIEVQRNDTVIDGAGFTLKGDGEERGVDLSNGRGQDPSRPKICNVMVKNLRITNFYYGVDNANTDCNVFMGNYIADCVSGFWIVGSLNNTLIYNTIEDCGTSISINFAGISNITKNNFINNGPIAVWLSNQPIVDSNYWSDYNGTDSDGDGVGDTPYVINEENQDNHPLMKPAVIPEFPSWISLLLLMVVVTMTVAIYTTRSKNMENIESILR